MSGSISASTLAYAAIGTSLLGTGLSAAGMAANSQAQAAQASYQSQVARNNSIIDQRNAGIATQQGEVDAQNSALKTLQTEGAQKAALASQGGDIDTGSDAGIIGDTAMAGKADIDTIRYKANMEAYGYGLQAAGATGSADAYEAAGANASAAAPLSIGTTLLGGASVGAGKWYQYMTGGNTIPNNGGLVGTGGDILMDKKIDRFAPTLLGASGLVVRDAGGKAEADGRAPIIYFDVAPVVSMNADGVAGVTLETIRHMKGGDDAPGGHPVKDFVVVAHLRMGKSGVRSLIEALQKIESATAPIDKAAAH